MRLVRQVDHARAEHVAHRNQAGDVGHRPAGQQNALRGVGESEHRRQPFADHQLHCGRPGSADPGSRDGLVTGAEPLPEDARERRWSGDAGEVTRMVAVLLILERDIHQGPHGLQRVTGFVRHRTSERIGQIVGVTHQYRGPLITMFEVLDHLVHHPVTKATHLIGGNGQHVGGQLIQWTSSTPNQRGGLRHDAHPCGCRWNSIGDAVRVATSRRAQHFSSKGMIWCSPGLQVHETQTAGLELTPVGASPTFVYRPPTRPNRTSDRKWAIAYSVCK